MGQYPANIVKNNLYTEGGEYIYLNGELAGTDYIGFYHIAQGRIFPGRNSLERKDDNKISTIELDFIPKRETDGFNFTRGIRLRNTLRDINEGIGYATRAYIFASNKIEQAKAISAEIKNRRAIKREKEGENTDQLGGLNYTGIHYFAKKSNSFILTEISEQDYNNLQQNPIYILARIDFDASNVNEQIENTEKKIPGFKTFLGIS